MIRIFLKYLLIIPLLCTSPAVLVYGWLWLTPLSLEEVPPLKDGDLVFQTMHTSQSLPILIATGSSYSHVGLVKINGEPEPVVVEAVDPVRKIAFRDWVKQGLGERISVYRINDLSEDQTASILQAALSHEGKPYDYYFLPGDNALYCSELAYKAYLEATGRMIGKQQQVKELNIHNPWVKDLIEQRWRTYPACHGSTDFESCYQIIMEQPLVSPASIAEDTQLELIYSNYGVFR